MRSLLDPQRLPRLFVAVLLLVLASGGGAHAQAAAPPPGPPVAGPLDRVARRDLREGDAAGERERRRQARALRRAQRALGVVPAPAGAASAPTPSAPPPVAPPAPPVLSTPSALSAAPAAAPGEGAAAPGEREFNECLRVPAGRRIKVTLKPESDLADLVGWISAMTCKQFIVAAALRGQKVTLVSPTPVTAGTAYHGFISALEVMGLTVVPAGRYLKVVQSNWALQSPIPTYAEGDGRRPPNSDEIVTQIVRAQHVDVNELLVVLSKLKSRNGDVTAYKATNSLIITDSGNNILRMMRVLKELDVELGGEKIWIVRMRSAEAEEVLKILQQVFGPQGAQPALPQLRMKRGREGEPPAPPVEGAEVDELGTVSVSKMVADPLTNSLIIVAAPASYLQIASLIKRLDVESEGVNQRIHVYNLENGSAEEVATTLSSLTSGGARSSATPGAATLFEGEVKVTADKATNSLVIVASTKDYLNTRRVIQELDVPRRQVFVEAVIMEVSLSKDRKLGLGFHGGLQVGKTTKTLLFGGLFGPDASSLALSPSLLNGLAAGARGTEIPDSGKLLGLPGNIPAFGIVLQALQTSGDVNVLSSPHLLTTDNQQAEITVGENLPFPAGVLGGLGQLAGQAGAAGLTNSLLPSISVQRQDVALKLRITPHVNASDMVRLEIEQEVSDVTDRSSTLGPTTAKREVKTTVVVRDQQTVVIGGLMKDAVSQNETKIPVLGDIPILGALFRQTQRSVKKTNLIIVLTPYVIRDQGDLRRIFATKLEERREFIERYTSFSAPEITHAIDFRHKHGLLAEMHRVGLQADEDAALLDQARKATEERVVPMDLPRTGPRVPASEPAATAPVERSADEAATPAPSGEPPPGRSGPPGWPRRPVPGR
ncbi:MAG: type II secretion system secretin GspD [Proteobacteria bacterium]|nr:type II secretion system secretin GspD [Pseudomonadota bacterium]